MNRKAKRWVKASAWAIGAVVLTKMCVGTSCFIPSTGMENSLYPGEGILVNKWSYGLRLPFPTLFGYHRMAYRAVKRGDIVVFNKPVMSRHDGMPAVGELYISRCIGAPGDTLMLDEGLSDTGSLPLSPDIKSLYAYPATYEDTLTSILRSLHRDDNLPVGYTPEGDYIRSLSHYEYYLVSQRAEGSLPLTPLNRQETPRVHPYVVPRKGVPVTVYPWNAVLLCNTIAHYEGRRATLSGDTLCVDGKPISRYTFKQDYCWMASNDPTNLSDSRLFGFVPESHLVGKAVRIWFSSHTERIFQRIQ